MVLEGQGDEWRDDREKRFESRRFSSHRKTANTWRGFRNRPTTRADRIRPITGPTYTPVVRKSATGQGLWGSNVDLGMKRVHELPNFPRVTLSSILPSANLSVTSSVRVVQAWQGKMTLKNIDREMQRNLLSLLLKGDQSLRNIIKRRILIGRRFGVYNLIDYLPFKRQRYLTSLGYPFIEKEGKKKNRSIRSFSTYRS